MLGACASGGTPSEDAGVTLPAVTSPATEYVRPGKFVWYDLATPDLASAKRLYGQLLGWSFGELDDTGNMSASGPAFVSAGTTGTISVEWSGLTSNTIYFGAVSHLTPQGRSGLTLITIGN